MKEAENIGFVIKKVIEAISLMPGKKLKATKENSIELLILQDLKELVIPYKNDIEALKRALNNAYLKSFIETKPTVFYNYRSILSEKRYLLHFASII